MRNLLVRIQDRFEDVFAGFGRADLRQVRPHVAALALGFVAAQTGGLRFAQKELLADFRVAALQRFTKTFEQRRLRPRGFELLQLGLDLG